jgi:thioredoxin-related protein
VLRVDILTPIGREFARRHDFVGTPTFVLFDSQGKEVKRWPRPPSLSELE